MLTHFWAKLPTWKPACPINLCKQGDDSKCCSVWSCSQGKAMPAAQGDITPGQPKAGREGRTAHTEGPEPCSALLSTKLALFPARNPSLQQYCHTVQLQDITPLIFQFSGAVAQIIPLQTFPRPLKPRCHSVTKPMLKHIPGKSPLELEQGKLVVLCEHSGTAFCFPFSFLGDERERSEED